MKNAMIHYIKNEKCDDIFTPYYAIDNFISYLDKSLIYWECCDNGNSNITKCLKDNGFNVISTTKEDLDFLKDSPSFDFDIIITNPPYSNKDDFIKRCYEYSLLGKGFALLLPLTALEGVYRNSLYRSFGLELCVFDKRINYCSQKKSNWFNSSWFCLRVLPNDLCFKELIITSFNKEKEKS